MTSRALFATFLASLIASCAREQSVGSHELPAGPPGANEGLSPDPRQSDAPSKAALARLRAREQPRFSGFQSCKLHIDCAIVDYGRDGCAVRLASIAVAHEREFMAKHGGDTGKRCNTRDLAVPAAAPIARCIDAQCAITWSETESYFHVSDY